MKLLNNNSQLAGKYRARKAATRNKTISGTALPSDRWRSL